MKAAKLKRDLRKSIEILGDLGKALGLSGNVLTKEEAAVTLLNVYPELVERVGTLGHELWIIAGS